MRPCPNCECFVGDAVRRCPRCAAELEPVEPPEVAPEHDARELVSVGASTTTDPIVRSVMARVALAPIDGPAPTRRAHGMPKLPQPFASDPLVLAVFLGIPRSDLESPPPPAPAPAPAPTRDTKPASDEPAADLSPATIAAIMEAAAEITAGGVSAHWTPHADVPDAALEKVIAGADAVLEQVAHAPEPAAAVETEAFAPIVEPATDDLLPAPEPESRPEPPTAASETTATEITATPIAAPVVLTADDVAPPPRRRGFKRRDAFTHRATKRERLLTKLCLWLALALGLAVFAMRLPIGVRPQLGASTAQTDGSIGTPESPATTPFADAVRIQTRADLQVVVTEAERLDAAWKSYAIAKPAVLAQTLPQFDFVPGSAESTRVGQMSVAGTAGAIAIAEYAGPTGCAYARVTSTRGEQFVVGETGTACRAADLPTRGWGPLDEG